MTVQISITLWTIICFVLLMIILHNLLFKPVLRVMDARREKIENAAAKKAEWERTEQEHTAMLATQMPVKSVISLYRDGERLDPDQYSIDKRFNKH